MLLPSVLTDERVFASTDDHERDPYLGFTCFHQPIPHAADEPVSIVRFEPAPMIMKNVHHITAFGCDAGVENISTVSFGDECASWDFTSGEDAPCRVVVYGEGCARMRRARAKIVFRRTPEGGGHPPGVVKRAPDTNKSERQPERSRSMRASVNDAPWLTRTIRVVCRSRRPAGRR